MNLDDPKSSLCNKGSEKIRENDQRNSRNGILLLKHFLVYFSFFILFI
jgi:hypothetical protein